VREITASKKKRAVVSERRRGTETEIKAKSRDLISHDSTRKEGGKERNQRIPLGLAGNKDSSRS